MLTKSGLLLINLGTPDGCEVAQIRPYLREFLSDPRVLDLPRFFRWCLVNLIIVPFRSPKSAKLYKSIWSSDHGSPLLFHGKDLVAGLEQRFAAAAHLPITIDIAMRYGKPSIACALQKFADRGIDDIVVLPLFPQYSSAAYGSAVAKVYSLAAEIWNTPRISIVAPYYNDLDYIAATAAVARPTMLQGDVDKVLFSFHGLPIRHCQKSVGSAPLKCGSENCCDQVTEINRNCYRAQCVETSRLLAKAMGLSVDGYETVFQSRFGRDPWIGPFLETRIVELARSGVRRLAVLTPSFTADCLETVEEIGERARASFLASGGHELRLAPCLNSHPAWIEAVSNIVEPYFSKLRVGEI